MRTSILLLATLWAFNIGAQNKTNGMRNMKMNAGIITDKFQETKEFYTQYLNFGVSFENDFYLLLHTSNHQAELSFLKPNHPSQNPMFHAPFSGQGIYLTIEMDNVDELYEELSAKDIEIHVTLRDEPWGDRHFTIVDPNGISIDLVTYKAPEE